MKNRFFIWISMLILIVFFTNCTVQKRLAITDGNRRDGKLTLSYEYRSWEDPVVNWEDAKRKARAKCREWGYRDAEFFESGTRDCIDSSDGDCNRWRVSFNCECVD